MNILIATVAVLTFATLAVSAAGNNCDIDAAVAVCAPSVYRVSACDYFKCIARESPGCAAPADIAERICTQLPPSISAAPLVNKTQNDLAVLAGKKRVEQSIKDNSARPIGVDNNCLGAEHDKPPITEVPNAASPCGFAKNSTDGKISVDEARHYLHFSAWTIYLQRAHETYSEDMQKRWIGIAGHTCPPAAPRYSDCSSSVTWDYWTLFGNGGDFLNGESWRAGYTGTLIKHGYQVRMHTDDLKVGDLLFYYHPMHHTAIYVGAGMVVTHGFDPVQFSSWYYTGRDQVDCARRYIAAEHPTPPVPPPPAPLPRTGCKTVVPGLCPGSADCECTFFEPCGGFDGGKEATSKKRVSEMSKEELRAHGYINAVGGCGGQCEKTEAGKCKYGETCKYSTGDKC